MRLMGAPARPMPPDPATLKDSVHHIARELGFDDCRVAAIRPATHGAEFREWIARGEHGDMAWLARNPDRRTDPALVLPGARAMIVLALNYHRPDPPPPAAGSHAAHGRIARYAWGDEYHDLIESRLADFCATLETLGGTQKAYVDTGPVLERDFATDAGLGWNGKSTVQIHPRLGTWFFLAEILTTLPVPPDGPLPDRCGRCTRCLDACPTQAIVAPHHVDARRCISYLTIEHKGAIPPEFRRAVGDRIYGCDDCLAACPWNRFARNSREAAFTAREFVHDWPLAAFLTLDDDGFRRLFKNSPIRRIKRPAFLRNVCVALGNVGTPADLPALDKAAGDPHPLISEHAQWAMEEIRHRLSVPP